MTRKAVLFMLISALAFTLMNITAKKLAHYNAYQLVFFRSLGTLIFTSGYLYYNKIPFLGNNQKLLILRSLVGFISMSMFFMSLHYLPVGSAVTIRYLAPVFAAIFSIVLLKERILPVQWLFFAMAFAGVVVLKYADIQINLIGLLMVLTSALFGGLVYITINKIGKREHPITIVNYFMVFCTLVGGSIAVFDWKTPPSADYLPLLSMGIYGYFGQLYMTKAFQIENVNKIAPVKYMEVIFTVLVGMSFFGEIYSLWSLLGIAMIVMGLLLNLMYRKKPAI